MSVEQFEVNEALSPLKKFQRRTVDYVFDRFYGKEDSVRLFLVADEVGLGKTLVARGVIAKTIEKLWDTNEQINILYICSNQAIAAQNINRLNVFNQTELALPTRITLIPLQLRNAQGLKHNKVNFISLTPKTTFEISFSTGTKLERAFILKMLKCHVSRPRGLYNLLQATAGVNGWKREVEDLSLDGVDGQTISRFCNDVIADTCLFEDLEEMCELFRRRRKTYPSDLPGRRNKMIGKLRNKLSQICIDALKPDLIIMDEFQRFPKLLHGKTSAADLARQLFDYSDGNGNAARTLLLSATPYRMLTLSGDDPDDGEHYSDFLKTICFLYGRTNGPAIVAKLECEMRQFRGFLRALPETRCEAISARKEIELRLQKVMSRTERVDSTIEQDSMLIEPPMAINIMPIDLRQAALVSDVANALNAPQIIEYWKSAPYLLNFMRDYKLNRLLKNELDNPSPDLRCAITRAQCTMLHKTQIDRYKPLKPANGRMRGVMEDVFGDKLDQHLWIPASLPYYGPERKDPPLTKALIFSSWSLVPDSIAATLSYEAERRMVDKTSNPRYFDKGRSRPLQFSQTSGGPEAMRAMHLVYPSPTLARLADPLEVFASHSETLSIDSMRKKVKERLRGKVEELSKRAGDSTNGRDWEWAAPFAIDVLEKSKAIDWVKSPTDFASLGNEEGFQEHVTTLQSAAMPCKFGPVPESLLDLLVDVALGSPAICALRALHRIAPDLAWDDPELLRSASRIAWGFRTLFNQHDTVALLRKGKNDKYWHRVLTFSLKHNLQAVLDEYVHNLVDSERLGARPPEERVTGISKAISQALAIRPSQIEVEYPIVNGKKLAIKRFQIRGRFAMRLADYKDEEGGATRLGSVRDAFNSPFRPFVLATTSIGQEGLDFHPYCYRVYHWNLPSNPVDIEQREGRVHRFKGHAIRLNLAHKNVDVVRGQKSTLKDPWKKMFDVASAKTNSNTELIPYWIYEGPVKVERRVPMLPFSREVQRLKWLKQSLTLYRLTFGQPRQEDLLEYLNSSLGTNADAVDIKELQIRLQP